MPNGQLFNLLLVHVCYPLDFVDKVVGVSTSPSTLVTLFGIFEGATGFFLLDLASFCDSALEFTIPLSTIGRL